MADNYIRDVFDGNMCTLHGQNVFNYGFFLNVDFNTLLRIIIIPLE